MTLEKAMNAYRDEFDDLPNMVGIPPEYEEDMAYVLAEAVADGEPLTDDEFRQAIGMDPLPSDTDT